MRRLFLALAVLVLTVVPAISSDKFAAPDLSEYFNTLRQPDHPAVSCCGDGDVYFADQVDQCGQADIDVEPTCALVAIITDTRPDDIKLPDGRTLHRMHISPGTRVAIPRAKLRSKAVVNPTDHNVVFTNGYTVYCWEPVSGQ